MTNKKLLEEVLKKKGLKKGFVAVQLGMTAQTFTNCLNNKAEFKASHIFKLCELLDIRDPKQKEDIFFAHDGAF